MKTIGRRAFDGCWFDEIKLPKGLVSIGEKAFTSNHAVTDIFIPSTVSSIGAEAFNYSQHIENVTVDRVTPPILGQDGFHQYTYFSACLRVPEEAKEVYKKTPEWSNFYYINENPEVGAPSPVSEPSAEEVEYYDLQGRKLSAPAGFCIRRSSASGSKVELH